MLPSDREKGGRSCRDSISSSDAISSLLESTGYSGIITICTIAEQKNAMKIPPPYIRIIHSHVCPPIPDRRHAFCLCQCRGIIGTRSRLASLARTAGQWQYRVRYVSGEVRCGQRAVASSVARQRMFNSHRMATNHLCHCSCRRQRCVAGIRLVRQTALAGDIWQAK